MTSDPDLAELTAGLAKSFPPSMRWDGWKYDCLIACHYFASDYYRGEHSRLYHVICSVGYDSKGLGLANESEEVCVLFEELERLYRLT